MSYSINIIEGKHILSKNDFKKTTKAQIRWWVYAAWTLPLTALAGLVFLHFFGWSNAYDYAVVIGSVTFFSISVFWWWWAIFKIKMLVELLGSVGDRIDVVREHVLGIRKDLKIEDDADNR